MRREKMVKLGLVCSEVTERLLLVLLHVGQDDKPLLVATDSLTTVDADVAISMRCFAIWLGIDIAPSHQQSWRRRLHLSKRKWFIF